MAREAVNRMAQELTTAISLGLLPEGELQSGVVYPDYSPQLYRPFPQALYNREQVTRTLPNGAVVPVDRAYNRLIFTTPGKRNTQFSDSLGEYAMVEFVVPPRTDNNNLPQNRLYRRTYRVRPNPLGNLPGLQMSGDYVVIQPNYFALDPADPLNNPNMLEAGLTPAQRQERCLLLELPNPNDQLQFSVEHNQYIPQRSSPLRRDPAFEPALFNLSVSVSIDNQGNGRFLASQVLNNQVTIRSGF
jgi:hypothetical protein